MRFLKLILKVIVGFVILILLAFLVLKFGFSKPLPNGEKGPEAEQLAQKMLNAVNYEAWDTLRYVQWSFRGAHHFVYDKTNNTARVTWDQNEVHLKMDEIQGRAFDNGTEIIGPAADKLVKEAWSHWCNDSFWFNAPAKVFDPGTERSVVMNDDGSKSLLVTYVSGGVTPGDSYLWILDDNGLPSGWRMWTKIIPVGGFYSSWDKWVELPNGAKISSYHTLWKMSLDIGDIKGGFSWSDLGFDQSPIKL